MDAEEFLLYIKAIGKENELKKYVRKVDQSMVNMLAKNIYNNFVGMNIDGAFTKKI